MTLHHITTRNFIRAIMREVRRLRLLNISQRSKWLALSMLSERSGYCYQHIISWEFWAHGRVSTAKRSAPVCGLMQALDLLEAVRCG